MKLKIILLFIISLFYIKSSEINLFFYLNGINQNNIKTYIVSNTRKCYLLGAGNKINLPDTLKQKDITLYVKSGNHNIVFSVMDWKNCKDVIIDYDSRLFNNTIKSKYGFPSIKRHKYYIKETTVDDIISVSKPKNKYDFPNGSDMR